MKKQRFTEQQITSVLNEQEAGAKVVDLCRKHGISEATYYSWKAKYDGMEVSEAKRLGAIEEENAKLKKLPVEPLLDTAALRKPLAKMVGSAAKHDTVARLDLQSSCSTRVGGVDRTTRRARNDCLDNGTELTSSATVSETPVEFDFFRIPSLNTGLIKRKRNRPRSTLPY
jgi:putative transposase